VLGECSKVVGEGNQKTVVYEDDEPFSDSMIPYKSFKGEYRNSPQDPIADSYCRV
jgi:chitin synthase